MTTHECWQRTNDEFLTMRLAWLRARFEELIEARSRSNDFANKSANDPANQVDIDGAAESADAQHDAEHLPALHILGNRLGLSAFEQDVLLLCTAMELDPRLPHLCALAQNDASRPYPTFALALTLFDDPAWDAISPERPLRRLRLVEVNQPGATPLTAAALRADEKIVNYIKGLNYLDDRLTPLLLPFDAEPDVALPPSQQAVADEVVTQLQSAASQGRGHLPLVQLVGADVASKQLVAQQVASTFGLELQRLPADLIPSDFHELETLLKLWDREHRLLPVALYVDAFESDAAQLEKPSSPQSRFLARAGGLVFLDAPDTRHLKGRPSLPFDIAKPTATEQRDLWQALLGNEDDATTASKLAGQFSLNAATIHRIASEGASLCTPVPSPPSSGERARVRGSSPAHCPLPTTHSCWSACRRATRPRLDALAQRIDARATWDDLVLPSDETQQLREITDQIQHRSRVYDDWGFRAKHNRGLGVSVLFAGESGTGKTMAAEVIANDLQLDLYRIDLSAVVNKYIGETEKNLRKLFDAADDSGAILFFDEADSLFGKRTEVKDSHDRYANLEVNYLLQRMEAYRGLAILATNLKSSLDQAFLRRLRFIVSFPTPDTAQRRELWSKAFPTETPLAPLDLDRLARLNVTGGNIHTIALNAAFASAHDGPQLSMPHILKAARAEYRKLQKPINAADFRTPELEGSPR